MYDPSVSTRYRKHPSTPNLRGSSKPYLQFIPFPSGCLGSSYSSKHPFNTSSSSPFHTFSNLPSQGHHDAIWGVLNHIRQHVNAHEPFLRSGVAAGALAAPATGGTQHLASSLMRTQRGCSSPRQSSQSAPRRLSGTNTIPHKTHPNPRASSEVMRGSVIDMWEKISEVAFAPHLHLQPGTGTGVWRAEAQAPHAVNASTAHNHNPSYQREQAGGNVNPKVVSPPADFPQPYSPSHRHSSATQFGDNFDAPTPSRPCSPQPISPHTAPVSNPLLSKRLWKVPTLPYTR
jgi:hypothetical protein